MEIKNLFNLKGKTALITGGSQGIGKAISLALAEYGADIIINYRSGNGLATETAEQIRKLGVQCHLFQVDISHKDSAKTISKFISDNKLHVDILVLNASVQIRNSWDKVSVEEFEKQINTNLRSTLMLIQEFYPGMKGKGWGRILTVGSVQQVRPHEQMIVYSASKVAQMSFVRSLAPKFAPFNVTINNIAPGAIETGRNEDVLKDKDYKKLVESKIPVGYIGEPIDCASAALLFCSDAGRYMTGQDLYIDGGMGLNV